MNMTQDFSLRRQFIDTPQAHRAFARLEEVRQDTLRSRTSKGLLVQGPSGVGKTTLIQEFISATFQGGFIPGKRCAAIRVEIPSSPSKKNLATAVLLALGDPFATSRLHSAEAKFQRIVKLLENLDVELVILDEAQHLIDYKRATAYEAADWIKSLLNATRTTFVLVGLQRTEQLLWANEQLRRRFSASVLYDRLRWDSHEDRSQFAALVKAIEGILPVAAVQLITDDMLRRLHHGSFGLIDYLIKILDRAVWLVSEGRSRGVDLDALAAAFRDEVWSQVPIHRNPFSADFNFVPLVGLHEPFEHFDNSEA